MLKTASRVPFAMLALAVLFIAPTADLIAQNHATFFLYRPSKLTNTDIDFKIFINGKEIAPLPNGGRVEYRCYETGRVKLTAGVYSEFMIDKENFDNSFMVDVTKGGTYYYKAEDKKLRPVNKDQGKREYEDAGEFRGEISFIDNKPAELTKNETADPAPVIMLVDEKLNADVYKTSAAQLKVAGYVQSKSNISGVKVNNEAVRSDEVGNFSKTIDLKEGMNRVLITALNEGGQKAEKVLNIVRHAEEQKETAAATGQAEVLMRGSDPFKGTNVANVNKELKAGKYFVLLIGIDSYTGTWTPLKNAVNDAKAIESLLRSDYRVDVVKTLYNNQATRSAIIDQLEWLVSNVKENDNVLIYYSGHGEFKKELNKGYWVPADAKTASTSQFISNSDLQTFLSGIPSKHTLLVSDACFSGDIFRGTITSAPFENSEKYYAKTYDLRSRQAISSGGIEPVMDGGRDGHSVFAYYFIQALRTNKGKYMDATQLYNKIKIPVVNNSEQSPNFNPIKNTGDEGGNFIFIRK